MTCMMQVSLLVSHLFLAALPQLRIASTGLTIILHALYDKNAAKGRKSDPAFLETDARRSDYGNRKLVRRYSCGMPCSAEYDVRSGPAGSGSVEYFASMRAFVDAKIHFS